MGTFMRLVVAFTGFAAFGLAFACSSVPISAVEMASAPAVSIGKIVREQVQETAPGQEYRRSRTVIVRIRQKLKGSMPVQVRVGISCGDRTPPIGSRVIVAMMEPGIFALALAGDGFEQSVRQQLRLDR